MSIEAMKRIKSLPQDTKMIDSHTISAVVAECDMAILAKQPATGEPVYWEWRHLSTHPNTVDFGQWSEWERVEARSAIHTIEGALAEFRAYIAQGYKYELRALYTTPQPAQATQAEVTVDIRPEDFTVDVVVKPMGGFAPVNTQGVRVTHKPTGISVICDAARSQHTNRHQAFEKLSAILATPTAQVQPAEVTDEQIKEAAVKAVKDGKLSWLGFEKDDQDKYTLPVISKSHYQFARAILALRPQQSGLTGCNCRWDGDTQVQWCELHLAHKDAIHEWAERAKEAEKQLAQRKAASGD